jgi:tetratricopeptide (TPR) repeat protein
MARVQLFLSTVSAEFLSYRERLRHLLTRPDVEVKVQEDFIVTGTETLEMLDAYIQGCDGVIHLVGDMTGSMAKPQSVAAIASRYPELGSRYPLAEFLQPGGPSLSYTQWEAWLALLHHKPLFIATPQEGAPRDQKYTCEANQQELQQAHLSRLKEVGRYPGTAFSSQEQLAAEVLRSFVLDLLIQAGLSTTLFTPHNLPERTTSAERFVGRSQELTQLKSLLAPEGSRIYLTGMGGVGKSELALQHANDSFDVYRGGILRLDARQGLDAMALQVVTFFRGRFPDVPLPEDISPTELLPVCWSQWPASANPPEPVLLILDDQHGDNEGYAAERQLLEGLPPRFRRLITQRETAPTTAQAIDLPLLKREASLELLALQAGQGGTERLQAEEQAADALCDAVGDLPLALVLLGARLSERPDLQLGQLLADLQAKGPEAKALRQAHPELGAKLGVVEALLISWEPLNEPAKSLALLLSVMAPAVIPWELVEACRLPEQEVEEGSAFGDAQAELLRSQFLERSGAGLYRLHPLVRQFLRLQSQGEPELVGRWRKQFAAAVAGISRQRIPEVLSLVQVQALEGSLPHIQLVAEEFMDDLEEKDLIWPQTGLGRLAEQLGAVEEALSRYVQLLEYCELRLVPGHPHIASTLNNLAKAQYSAHHLEEAEALLRKAIELEEASYEKGHSGSLGIYNNNLAMVLEASGRLDEAEPLMRKALEIDEDTLGPSHPYVASSLLNLGGLQQQMGRPAEAEPLMRRALAIDEASYGPEHPIVATDLNNLALLLKDTGRLMEAEPLMRKVVQIFMAFERHGYQHLNLEPALSNYRELLQEMCLPEADIQAKFQSLQPPT